jgi:hypothetical protein
MKNKITREYVPTRKIQDKPTPLNLKRIDIKVIEG